MSCENEQHDHNHDHNQSHNHDHSHSPPPLPTNAAQSVLQQIDTSKITSLNIAVPSETHKLFKAQSSKYETTPEIVSDCDEQMIINIPFISTIKLYSITIRSSLANCPKVFKLYKNTYDLDFESDKKPDFKFTHPQIGYATGSDEQDESQFVEHHVPRYIFSGVDQLTLFIEDGYDEYSGLLYIELRGEWVKNNRENVVAIYESAARPTDHKIAEVTNSLIN